MCIRDSSNSAVKVIHGLHTGRKEGAPITDLALDLLEEIQKKEADGKETRKGITYFTQNKKGEPLKSVTIPIRGEQNRIIGLLCINFSMNLPFSEYLKNFVGQGIGTKPQEAYENRKENFSANSVELLEDMAEEIRQEVMEDKGISTANRNKEIISRPVSYTHLGLTSVSGKMWDGKWIENAFFGRNHRIVYNTKNKT